MSFMSAEIRSRAPRLTGRRVRQGASVSSAALLLAAALTGCAGSAKAGSDAIQASGSTTVAPVASDAAKALKDEGLNITVATQGGSAGGISQLGTGQINIALSSKPLSDKDHKTYPDTDFVTTQIGADAVGVIITKEVVDGGVKGLSKAQVAGLFEGKITNWKEVGGPDLQVFVYDKEPGRGTREVLDKFIYAKGEPPAPPKSANYAVVGGNLETRNKLKSTRGSIAPLSTGFIDGHPELVAVPLEGVAPTLENVASGKYPMTRPLYMITNGKPKGTVEQYIDYILSPEGQKLLPEHGYLTREQMGL